MAEIVIYTDGGSRGNPGPSALGVYIQKSSGEVLARIGKYLGVATNNFAEYSAIVEGLSWALENKQKEKIEKISFYMDSQLAFSQLSGLYKIKNQEAEIAIPVFYHHIPREKNKQADFMVNLALDNQLKNA